MAQSYLSLLGHPLSIHSVDPCGTVDNRKSTLYSLFLSTIALMFLPFPSRLLEFVSKMAGSRRYQEMFNQMGCTLYALAIVVVGVRTYCRPVAVRNFTLDDGFMVVALVSESLVGPTQMLTSCVRLLEL